MRDTAPFVAVGHTPGCVPLVHVVGEIWAEVGSGDDVSEEAELVPPAGLVKGGRARYAMVDLTKVKGRSSARLVIRVHAGRRTLKTSRVYKLCAS